MAPEKDTASSFWRLSLFLCCDERLHGSASQSPALKHVKDQVWYIYPWQAMEASQEEAEELSQCAWGEQEGLDQPSPLWDKRPDQFWVQQ